MADDITPTGAGAPAAAITIPAIPATDRLTVPASAIFDADDLALPVAPQGTPQGTPQVTPPVAPPVAPAADKVAADKVAADKVAADKVAADKVAADKVAADKAAASQPVKVKVGGKEYTQAELEKLLADRAAQAQTPPAAAPVQDAPKPPSAEEVAKAETDWCARFAREEKLNFAPTSEEVETILSGGEDAAQLLGVKLSDICAKAVLLARKSVYADMNPALQRIQQDMSPLLANNSQVEAVTVAHQFTTLYPDFKEHMATARQVGEALLARYPQECARMTREQMLAEVAAQTDRILQEEYKRWNPTAAGTWRDASKAAAPAAPAAAPAPAPVVAPAANSPAASSASGVTQSWHKSTAASLAE